MKKGRLVAGVAALCIVVAASIQPLLAQKENAELERIRGEINAMRQKVDVLNSRARSVEQELERLALEVQIRQRELEVTQARIAAAERERNAARASIEKLSGESDRQKVQLSKRLRQLYKMGGLSYLRLLLTLDSRSNPLEAIGMLSYLVSRDSREIEKFSRTQRQLDQRQTVLVAEEKELSAALGEMSRRKRDLLVAQQQQQRALAEIQFQSRSSTQRLAVLEEKARRLERLMTLLYERRQTGATKEPIAQFKGALAWPVRGAVIEEFGKHRSEQFATYTVTNGIKIASPANTEVRAVYRGTVLYSQWFKGYGNLMIVDHGDRVFSLYGNTRIGVAKVGDTVEAGQVIATVNSSEENDSGYLYFEIRENNKPVNPRGWLR